VSNHLLVAILGRRRTASPVSLELKQALDDFQDSLSEFKTTHKNELNAIKRVVEDQDLRLQKLVDNGVSAHRSTGIGWLDLKALGSSPDPSGGFLINEEHSNVFIDALRPESVLLRAGARVFQTEASAVNFPGLAADAAATWRGEGEQLTSGDPTFRRVRATIKKLQAFTVVSNEALSDSRPEIARLVEQSMSASLGLGIDRAAFDPFNQTTNAAAAPIPFASVPGIETITDLGADGGVPANLNWFTSALAKLLINNGRPDRAALFLSARTFGTLLSLKKLTSGSNEPLLWSDRALDGGPIARLMGVPVYVTSVLPDDLTQGNSTGVCSTAWLIDTSAVYVVVRSGTRIELDRSRYFDTDQSARRATMRGDVVLAQPSLAISIPGFKVS
jgi:HK97 family phage major capsid protein